MVSNVKNFGGILPLKLHAEHALLKQTIHKSTGNVCGLAIDLYGERSVST